MKINIIYILLYNNQRSLKLFICPEPWSIRGQAHSWRQFSDKSITAIHSESSTANDVFCFVLFPAKKIFYPWPILTQTTSFNVTERFIVRRLIQFKIFWRCFTVLKRSEKRAVLWIPLIWTEVCSSVIERSLLHIQL